MTNSITIAPQVSNVASLFRFWKQSNVGSYQDFISFITRPSGERSRFLLTVQVTGSHHGSLLYNQVSTGDNA